MQAPEKSGMNDSWDGKIKDSDRSSQGIWDL